MNARYGIIPIVVAGLIGLSAPTQADARELPRIPSTAAQSTPEEPNLASYLVRLVRRWAAKPPVKLLRTVAKKQIKAAASDYITSGGTDCSFPLPQRFCQAPVRQLGLGQALSYLGRPPGVWTSPVMPRRIQSPALVPGTVYYLYCWVLGDLAGGPYGTSTLWYQVSNGGYVADALLYTGTNNAIPGVDHC